MASCQPALVVRDPDLQVDVVSWLHARPRGLFIVGFPEGQVDLPSCTPLWHRGLCLHEDAGLQRQGLLFASLLDAVWLAAEVPSE